MIHPIRAIWLVHNEKLQKMNISFCSEAYNRNYTRMQYREIDWFIHSPFAAGVHLNYAAGLVLSSHTYTLRQMTTLHSDCSHSPALLLPCWVCKQLLKEPSVKLFLLLKAEAIGNQIEAE